MAVIYEPRGKAREYSPLACNLYKGCGHGCIYCYAPSATFRERSKFYGEPEPRKGILDAITKESEKVKPEQGPVLLCFTCDPYQPLDSDLRLTRQALEIFAARKIPVQILTKGGLRACRDFDLLATLPNNQFSVTLTHDDPVVSTAWEPGAGPPAERIESLKRAHNCGIATWVSFEPVFDPGAVYRLVEATHSFVDFYKVGKLNYHKDAKTIDWMAFLKRIKSLLESHGKNYLIKSDLAKFS
jgi:DNA repair photolyase